MNSRALYGLKRSQYCMPLMSSGPDSVGREMPTTSIVSGLSSPICGSEDRHLIGVTFGYVSEMGSTKGTNHI